MLTDGQCYGPVRIMWRRGVVIGVCAALLASGAVASPVGAAPDGACEITGGTADWYAAGGGSPLPGPGTIPGVRGGQALLDVAGATCYLAHGAYGSELCIPAPPVDAPSISSPTDIPIYDVACITLPHRYDGLSPDTGTSPDPLVVSVTVVGLDALGRYSEDTASCELDRNALDNTCDF